jgi:fucose permease
MGLIASLSSSRRRLLFFLSCCLAFIAMGIAQSMYGPFYGLFRELFELSAAQVSTITALHFTGATIAIASSGVLTRRLGAFPVVISGAALLTVGYGGIAAGPSWAVVLAAAFVLGTGFGALVSLNFLIAQVFKEYAASALSLVNALFSFGSMIGPLLASPFIAQQLHWPAFLIGGGVALAVLALFVLQPQPAEGAPAAPTPFPRTGRALAGIGAFLLMYFFYVAAETAFANWIPTHLALRFDMALASQLTSIFWIALTAGRLIAVPVATKVGAGRIVAGSLTLALGGTALAHILALGPIAYALAGFAIGPIFPVGLAWLSHRFPNHNNRVSAFVLAGAGIGGVAGPPIVGVAVDAVGARSIPTTIEGLLIVAAAAALTIAVLSRRGTSRDFAALKR